MSSARNNWIIGTAIVCIGLLLAGWFLIISPKLDEADASRSDTEAVRAQNDITAAKVAVLAKQFAELDASKAELAGLEVGIPTHENLSAYLTTVNDLAVLHQVTVVSMTPSLPIPVVQPEVSEEAVPVPVPSETEDASSDEGEDAAEEPTDEPTTIEGSVIPGAPTTVDPVITGFATVPFTLTLVGPYANTVAFISDLQTATARLVLVSGVNIVSQPDAAAREGRPATVAGDLETVVSGYTYVLVNPLSLAEELLAQVGAEPAPLPVSETPRFFPLPDNSVVAPQAQ